MFVLVILIMNINTTSFGQDHCEDIYIDSRKERATASKVSDNWYIQYVPIILN